MKHKWLALLLILAVTVIAAGLSASTAYAQSYVHHIVAPGDTLGKIAYRYCTSWKDIYAINRDTIGNDPNVIQPGMALTIPAHCDKGGSSAISPPASGAVDSGPINHATGVYRAPYYTVAWGDALSSIGQRFGVPWQEIATANGVKGTLIYAGQTLLIPTDGGTGTLPPLQTPPERVYFASRSHFRLAPGHHRPGSTQELHPGHQCRADVGDQHSIPRRAAERDSCQQ